MHVASSTPPQCSSSGHPVCGSCLPGVTSCPTCRGVMGAARATGMEAILRAICPS